MAKIQLGQFGGRVAPAATEGARANPRSAFVSPESGVGDQATRTAVGMLREERHEQAVLEQKAERERAINEDQARRNKAAAAFAQYQVDVEELSTSIGTEMTEGRIKRDDARKGLDKGLADLKKKHLEELDPASRAALGDNLILFDGRANTRFNGALRDLAKKERADGFNANLEALERLALTDREGAMKQAQVLYGGEGVALFGADKAGKGMQQFREKVTFTDLDRRVTASQQDAAGLKAIGAELASDKYADLAPERRGFLEGRIQRAELHLAQQGEIAERRRLTKLDMQQRRLGWYVENGKEIPKAEFDAFVKASKGTPFEGVADGLVQEQKAVSELAGLTPEKMVEKVKSIEAAYGATPSKEQIVHVEKLKRFAGQSIKLLQESPLTFAVDRENAQVERLDIADPTSWASNLANRSSLLTEQSRRTGVAPKGLFPDEVQALTGFLRTAKVEDKRQILSALRSGFGDDKVFKATMQQIAPDDPVLAAAGIAAARGITSQKDRLLADEILRGQEVLRPNRKEDGKPAAGKGLQMPGDKELMGEWASRARDAFANNTEAGDLFFQTARAIYAARTDAAGDMSGQLDAKRWEESIQAATGGFVKHRGRYVVPPPGMGESDFRDGLKSRADQIARSGRLDAAWTADRLMDLPLQNRGDGVYIARIGDGKLVDKAGRDVVIDFNEPLPFTTSGGNEGPVTPSASLRARVRGDAKKSEPSEPSRPVAQIVVRG